VRRPWSFPVVVAVIVAGAVVVWSVGWLLLGALLLY
jgi:hypothetical protein